jgi:hypothetical protein
MLRLPESNCWNVVEGTGLLRKALIAQTVGASNHGREVTQIGYVNRPPHTNQKQETWS